MCNKEQTDYDQKGVGREIVGERRGRVKSRNMYKGPMDKNNGGRRIECGRWTAGRAGESSGEKMGTTVIEQQLKNVKKRFSVQSAILSLFV